MAEREAAEGLELVAPAGEWAALVAAVQNGAEAVYVGGTRFSARQYAPNFNPEELVRAVEYAHLRDCRLYVAVNTLVKEEELEEAARYLVDLYRWGVDAVILQDPGLARLARSLVPRLRLHASTQLTVHNSAGARTMEEWGFSRVVLARELSREEIAALRRATALELEVFVHGALCFCYSGQCLMSSLIGGRSGNRGRCAQPCRMKYRLVEEASDRQWREKEGVEEAHLLSTRDLCLVEHLPALASAGVRALKIEGRMKRPEYVATVVRIYRAVLDRWREGKEARPTPAELRELAQIFNRGFTTGYFLGNPGRELMSYQRPSNRGLLVGRVERYDPQRRRVQIRLEENLAVGDGIEVWVSRGGRTATVVRDLMAYRPKASAGWSAVEEARAGEVVSFPLEGRATPGDRVFCTSDASLLREARETWREGEERHPIPLRAVVEVAEGKPLRLIFRDPAGRSAAAETEFRAQKALRHPLREEVLRRQLGRLGGTPFFLAGLEVRGAEGVMVPLSELNEVRRRAVAGLMEKKLSACRPAPAEVEAAQKALRRWGEERARGPGEGRVPPSERPLLAVAVNSARTAMAALEAGARRLYLDADLASREPGVLERAHRVGAEVFLAFPRILHEEELNWALDVLAEAGGGWGEKPDGVLVGNWGLWYRARERRGFRIWWDWPLPVCNSLAGEVVAEGGAEGVTLSLELRREELAAALQRLPVKSELVVHGPLPLMVSRHCAVGALVGSGKQNGACGAPCRRQRFGLRDRTGLVFPVVTDQWCRMEIFNPMELCLLDRLGEVVALGFHSLRIEARHRHPEYAARVVEAYRKGLAEVGGPEEEATLARLYRELAELAPQGVTRGHFLRGVE